MFNNMDLGPFGYLIAFIIVLMMLLMVFVWTGTWKRMIDDATDLMKEVAGCPDCPPCTITVMK